jgi:outer membrane protein OmpA-like peptidoglycan-associated protein
LKKNYGLLAAAKGFLSVDENINLVDSVNYVEINKDLYLVPIEDDIHIKLNNIFFARSEFYLLPESYPELNRFAQVLKDNPNMVIQLEGHTEIFGKKKDQYDLAKNRVNTVKKYLVEKGGIKEDRIKLKSFGGSQPECMDKTDECRAKNRRVEFRILKH